MSEKGEILYRVPLSSSDKNRHHFLRSEPPGEKKEKTPNGDEVGNNIVIPSFYKNIIFTSLSETSFLRLYTVQGNNKRN